MCFLSPGSHTLSAFTFLSRYEGAGRVLGMKFMVEYSSDCSPLTISSGVSSLVCRAESLSSMSLTSPPGLKACARENVPSIRN